METWNKHTEKFLNDYKRGKLHEMKEDLETLLFLEVNQKVSTIKDNWSTITAMEESVKEYKRGALTNDGYNSKIFKEALEDLLFIDKRIKAKKAFVQEYLDQELILEYKKIEKDFDINNEKTQTINKQKLRDLSNIAEIIDYEKFNENVKKLESVYEKKIQQIVEKKFQEEERKVRLTSIITKSEKELYTIKNENKLEEIKNELSSFLQEANLSKTEKEQINNTISKYDKRIEDTINLKKKKTRNYFSNFLKAGLATSILYLGIMSVKALQEPVDDKITAYKQEQIIKRGGREAEKKIQHYETTLHQKKKELETIESKLEQVTQEIKNKQQPQKETIIQEQAGIHTTLQRKREEAEKTPYKRSIEKKKAEQKIKTTIYTSTKQELLATRLQPVLPNKSYTLYIEKNSNNTFLFNSYGELLYQAKHTDARDTQEKQLAGQNRTPEGIFNIDKMHFNKDWYTDELYGVGFIRVDYPNQEQIRRGYTGDGILICSAANNSIEQAINQGKDVMNCGIAYKEHDFGKIYEYVNVNNTQIIIEDYKKRPLQELQEVDL